MSAYIYLIAFVSGIAMGYPAGYMTGLRSGKRMRRPRGHEWTLWRDMRRGRWL